MSNLKRRGKISVCLKSSDGTKSLQLPQSLVSDYLNFKADGFSTAVAGCWKDGQEFLIPMPEKYIKADIFYLLNTTDFFFIIDISENTVLHKFISY